MSSALQKELAAMESRQRVFEDGARVVLARLSRSNVLHGCGVEVGTGGTVSDGIPDADGDVYVLFDSRPECPYYCDPRDLELEAKPADPHRAAGRLFTAAGKLGPRAMVVLAAVAERLAKGATEHGDFAPGSCPNPDRETAEELLDGIVYQTVKALRAAGEL
jgi:hypothetical protein